MAGLALLQEYSSDTDEEEISHENEAVLNVQDTKIKLPLPQSILTLKGVVHHEEVVDDPLKHDGRIRSFKHERGHWATLIYVDYIPNEDLLLWMKNVIAQSAQVNNIFDEFHVSLTRTLILKYHWIDSFVEAVKNISNTYQKFVMELGSIQMYCNDDRTRTFIGITVSSTNNSIDRLIQAFDKLMDEYQLPQFYKDASYHISFLWCLGDQRKILEPLLLSLTSSFDDFLTNHPEQRYVQIDSLKCKIGNKLYNFNLRQ